MFAIVRVIRRRNHARRQQNRALIRMRREIRERYDPFLLPDDRFIELFRLSKVLLQNLIELVRPHLQLPTTVRGISIQQKILLALRFYATGTYQRGLGEEYNFGLSQTAVHFCLHEVTNAISEHLPQIYIRFPDNLVERNANKLQFLDKFGFPGTIGAIDCTHIAILKPIQEEEHNFYNRKGFHSINCQIIANADMKILNIFGNYGGSTHDSFIWNNSEVKRFLENNLDRGEITWLIGDSGYPQSKILMTPFRDPPEGTPEARYNSAHIRARNVVERTIGVWKMRFRSILRERTARYSPDFVCKLIKATAVLHNICVDNNLPLQEVIQINDIHEHDIGPLNLRMQNEGMAARQRVVNRYFRN